VTLWDVATGVGVPLSGTGATQTRFSRDGHRLVAANGGYVSVWDDRMPDEPDDDEQTLRSTAWHLAESRAAEQRGAAFAVLHHLRMLPGEELLNGELRTRRAVANAQLDNWTVAADEFEGLARENIAPVSNSYHAAILRLRSGDEAAYRALCQRMCAELGSPPNPDAVNSVAWAWCFAERDTAELERLCQQLEEVLPKTQGREARLARLNTFGAVLYRLGRWQEAIDRLEESIEGRGQGGVIEDWLFLAMAAQRTDRPEEARRRLAQARAEIEKSNAVTKPAERRRLAAAWERRVTVDMLFREARQLIERDGEPADAALKN
ncbi:MAG TPA: hypothetical protein PLV92_09445, partial [Pirellulaceae bacterium]|nr:hypothetical protein [Pirellulaceae bacterium]